MRHSGLTIRRGFQRTTRRGHEDALTAFASECHAFGLPNCTTHLVILGHKKTEHVQSETLQLVDYTKKDIGHNSCRTNGSRTFFVMLSSASELWF